MSKSDLIDAVIAATPGTSRVSASAVVEAVFRTIADKVESGEGFRVKGFGSFSVKSKPARKGRDFGTGMPIDIPERRRVVFVPGVELKRLVGFKPRKKRLDGAVAAAKGGAKRTDANPSPGAPTAAQRARRA